jgi:hypothetical protein
MAENDQALASNLAQRIADARASLESEMAAAGLRARDGWRIAEEVRHTVEGTDFIFRPIHMKLAHPEMERRVSIDHEGRPV